MMTKSQVKEFIEQLIADGNFNTFWNFNYIPQKIVSINSVYQSNFTNGANRSLPSVYSNRQIYLIDWDFMPNVPNPPVLETNYAVQYIFHMGPTYVANLEVPFAFTSNVVNTAAFSTPLSIKDVLCTRTEYGYGVGYCVIRGWIITLE